MTTRGGGVSTTTVYDDRAPRRRILRVEQHCHACGKVWVAPNARGQDQPTDASLERDAKKHTEECHG